MPRCRSRSGSAFSSRPQSGRPLGWIVEPQRRRYLTFRWNGRLHGARVLDGRYLIRLVESGRQLASSPLRIDQTTPKVTNILAHNRSREPFQGDNDRLTTISPNGDGLREAAKISFTLSERARVHFEVTRTVSSPQTIYELTANLRPGRNTFTWHPHWSVGARTYLVRITATDGAGNRRTYGADNAREGRRLKSAVVRVLGVDAGFTAESYVALERGPARDRDRRRVADAADLPRRAGGHADTQRHADERRAREPARDDPLERPPPPRDAQLRSRAVADGRLLRQADRQRPADRLCAVHRPADRARRDEPRRGRDADEHVAGLQLPRRRRQRLGRHLVRKRGPEHRRARPHVHPARRAPTVAQVRRRLRALAARDGQAARHPDRDRPSSRSARPRS